MTSDTAWSEDRVHGWRRWDPEVAGSNPVSGGHIIPLPIPSSPHLLGLKVVDSVCSPLRRDEKPRSRPPQAWKNPTPAESGCPGQVLSKCHQQIGSSCDSLWQKGQTILIFQLGSDRETTDINQQGLVMQVIILCNVVQISLSRTVSLLSWMASRYVYIFIQVIIMQRCTNLAFKNGFFAFMNGFSLCIYIYTGHNYATLYKSRFQERFLCFHEWLLAMYSQTICCKQNVSATLRRKDWPRHRLHLLPVHVSRITQKDGLWKWSLD